MQAFPSLRCRAAQARSAPSWARVSIAAACSACGMAASATNLYVTASDMHNPAMPGVVHQFEIQADGSLNPLLPPAVLTGPDPQNMLVLPSVHNNPPTALVAHTATHRMWQYQVTWDVGLHWLGEAGSINLLNAQPGALAVAPDGRFVFMSNLIGAEILTWPANMLGLIEPEPPRHSPTGQWPGPMAVLTDDWGDGHLYVAARDGGGGLYAYTIDAGTGLLLELPSSPIPSHSPAPRALLAYNPNTTALPAQAGMHLYLANTDPPRVTHLHVHPDGDPESAYAQINAVQTGMVPLALAIDPRGRFLYAGGRYGQVHRFEIHPDHGHLAPGQIVVDLGPEATFTSIASHRTPDDLDVLYVADATSSHLRSYRIDGDGRLHALAATPLREGAFAMRIVIAEP